MARPRDTPERWPTPRSSPAAKKPTQTLVTLVTSQSDTLRLAVAALVIVLFSELIGIVDIPLGIGKIVLLPMLWALLIGATWSLAGKRLPAPLQIGAALQRRSAAILLIAVLIFVAKLGLLVGASLPKLATAGWATSS